MGQVLSLAAMARRRRTLRRTGKKVVFTNGTFDILHRGHVSYLQAARNLGDVLVVGLNTDASIRRIKGPKRPINVNRDRADVLAALRCVDYVVFFGDDTPARLIARLLPDVLVKGADWKKGQIVGGDVVEAHGGTVRRIRLTPGRSTTNVIQRVLDVYCPGHGASARAK
ncbi:MAG: D-glycero-beta-D-manno-heptose 1-phosphate adenylyltransferase [Bacteroidetes bacterium]|nr:D-glycero-beta-D-manno-heptose 1-phosphate adenylyltransferase [Bacteroidota bacterium]